MRSSTEALGSACAVIEAAPHRRAAESFDQFPRTLGQLPQHKSWMFNTILGRITEHLGTLQEYPPTQRGSSLSTDQLVQQLLSQVNQSHPAAN